MPTQNAVEKFSVTFENFGELFHTSLRKNCDSSPTTLMYNIIRIVSNDTWTALIETMRADNGDCTFATHQEFAVKISLLWREAEVRPQIHQQYRNFSWSEWYALTIAAEYLTITDWCNATFYLWDLDKTKID